MQIASCSLFVRPWLRFHPSTILSILKHANSDAWPILRISFDRRSWQTRVLCDRVRKWSRYTGCPYSKVIPHVQTLLRYESIIKKLYYTISQNFYSNKTKLSLWDLSMQKLFLSLSLNFRTWPKYFRTILTTCREGGMKFLGESFHFLRKSNLRM